MSNRCFKRHGRVLTRPAFLKWLIVPASTLAMLLMPGLITAQQPPTGNQSAVPPATKKDSGGAPGVPPLGGAPAKATPIPQGPIKNDDDPRVKAAVARAVGYFQSVRYQALQVGELSLVVHALAKVHEKYPDLVSDNDPVYVGAKEKLRSYCQSDGF